MNDQSLESEVQEFYAAANLPEERVTALMDATAFVVTAARWKRAAIAATIGMAATTLIAIGLYLNPPGVKSNAVSGTINGSQANSERPVLSSPAFPSKDTPSPLSVSDPAKDGSASTYRLVAFRSHGDRCPYCRATGQAYEELAKTLGDEPISMDLFDLSRVGRNEQVDRRIDDLHLNALIDGRIETAFLAIVDHNGKKVREFKPSMKLEQIAATIRETIGQ